MKTLSDLFSRLCDPAHLERAARLATAGKRRRRDVAAFLFKQEALLEDLAAALAAGAYRPGRFELLLLRDPKPRIISRASVLDRVVHAALIDLLDPALTGRLCADAFACAPGRGTHRAVLRLRALMQRHRLAVHLDIRAYFASVDLDILRGLLARRVRDARFLAVVDRVLEAGAGLYDDPAIRAFARYPPGWPPPGQGLPIGALTSQVFASHLYLDGLDHFIKRELKVPGYVRYVDDLFLFGDSRAALRGWREAVGAWLWEQRRLKLKHPDARPLCCAGHLDALGHRVTREGQRALPQAGRRLKRRLREAWARGDGVASAGPPRARGAGEVDLARSVAASVGVLMF